MKYFREILLIALTSLSCSRSSPEVDTNGTKEGAPSGSNQPAAAAERAFGERPRAIAVPGADRDQADVKAVAERKAAGSETEVRKVPPAANPERFAAVIHDLDDSDTLWVGNSADGRLAASLTSGSISIHGFPGGQLLHRTSAWKGNLKTACFSGDSTRLALATEDGEVVVYRLLPAFGVEKRFMTTPVAIAMAFDRLNGNLLVLTQGAVSSYSLASGAIDAAPVPLPNWPHAALSSDGTLLAVAHGHGGVKLISLADGRVVAETDESLGEVNGLAFSVDGSRLAVFGGVPAETLLDGGQAGNAWGYVSVYASDDLSLKYRSKRGLPERVTQVALSAAGGTFIAATGAESRFFRGVLGATQEVQAEPLVNVRLGPSPVISLTSGGERALLGAECNDSLCSRATMLFWSAAGGIKEPSAGAPCNITNLRRSRSGRYLSVEAGKDVIVWDLSTGMARTYAGQAKDGLMLAISDSGEMALFSGSEGSALISLVDGRRLWALPQQLNPASFAPDGRHIAVNFGALLSNEDDSSESEEEAPSKAGWLNLDSGQVLTTIDASMDGESATGSHLLLSTSEGLMVVANNPASANRLPKPRQVGGFGWAMLSPSGAYLIWPGPDGYSLRTSADWNEVAFIRTNSSQRPVPVWSPSEDLVVFRQGQSWDAFSSKTGKFLGTLREAAREMASPSAPWAALVDRKGRCNVELLYPGATHPLAYLTTQEQGQWATVLPDGFYVGSQGADEAVTARLADRLELLTGEAKIAALRKPEIVADRLLHPWAAVTADQR